MPDTEPPYIDGSGELGMVAVKYLDQVLRGERREAQETIRAAMERGITPKDVYLDIIQRTQYEVGRRWQLGLRLHAPWRNQRKSLLRWRL